MNPNNQGKAMHLRYPLVLLAVSMILSAGCSHKKKNNPLVEIDRSQLKQYLHHSYFSKTGFHANLVIERKDSDGIHRNSGSLFVDRNDTSRLVINQKKKFTMRFTSTRAAIQTGKDKPLELDLTNINHNIASFREISVLEFNPFRYLARFYKYYLDTSCKDTTRIIARIMNKQTGDIKIEIQKETGLVLNIYFYSVSGDMGRHVHYSLPVRVGPDTIPSLVIIDFASGGQVVRERYELEHISLIDPKSS